MRVLALPPQVPRSAEERFNPSRLPFQMHRVVLSTSRSSIPLGHEAPCLSYRTDWLLGLGILGIHAFQVSMDSFSGCLPALGEHREGPGAACCGARAEAAPLVDETQVWQRERTSRSLARCSPCRCQAVVISCFWQMPVKLYSPCPSGRKFWTFNVGPEDFLS